MPMVAVRIVVLISSTSESGVRAQAVDPRETLERVNARFRPPSTGHFQVGNNPLHSFVLYCHGDRLARTVLTSLHDFNGSDGSDPVHVYLVQGVDGNFYGTTLQGGAHSHGTVFKMAPNGTLTTLFSFGNGGTDPQGPSAGLVLGNDGNFYGTTRGGGGTNAVGTVYKITPAGTITFLHSFTSATDGGGPEDGLIQATDGNFYGTTIRGGAHDGGTVFKMTPSGTVTVLYNFCSQNNGAELHRWHHL